jgi:peptidoglycan hydrolase CwlO-like protein
VGQSDAAKRFELQEQIDELRVELNHLDSQINGTEAQLVTEGEHLAKYILFSTYHIPKSARSVYVNVLFRLDALFSVIPLY